jgi:hypothetical protein
MATGLVENGCFLYDQTADHLIPNPLLTTERRMSFRAMRERIESVIPQGTNIEPGKEVCVSLNPPEGMTIFDLYELVCDTLQEFLLGGEIEILYSNSAVDIIPRGINKGSGIVFLCEYLRTNNFGEISPENILYIGDSNNDIPGLKFAGFAGCPDNASAQVKALVRERGGYVASRPFMEGVLEILLHFEVIGEPTKNEAKPEKMDTINKIESL